MCRTRWQLIYKTKYVCTHCEKSFKENGTNIPFKPDEVNRDMPKICPDCRQEMEAVSSDFRAPLKGAKQWKVLRQMQRHGIRIMGTHSCGCVIHGPVPKAMYQVEYRKDNDPKLTPRAKPTGPHRFHIDQLASVGL